MKRTYIRKFIGSWAVSRSIIGRKTVFIFTFYRKISSNAELGDGENKIIPI